MTRALTLHQPWASLVALGVKTIETRGWSTKYRGPLLIHAGAKAPGRNDWNVGEFHVVGFGRFGWALNGPGLVPFRSTPRLEGHILPLGAVVATCTLVDVVPMVWRTWPQNVTENYLSIHSPAEEEDRLVLWTLGEKAGRNVTDQRPYGDFAPGRYAWLLTDVRPLTPVPAKGRQGLWTPDADLIAAVEADRG